MINPSISIACFAVFSFFVALSGEIYLTHFLPLIFLGLIKFRYIFEILKLCDWILFPFANDVYARTKMEQYSYILKALRLQELEMHTIYVDMDKTMRQAVKEAAGELEIKSGKGHMYVKSRTTS